MCTNSFPTRSLIKYHHFIDDDNFPWGCGKIETTRHAIFVCPWFSEVWSEYGCDVLCAGEESLDMYELVVKWREVESKVRLKGLFLSWCIWGERNQRVFDDECTPNHVLVARVQRLVDDYIWLVCWTYLSS